MDRKAAGMVRRVDELGRVVLPAEIRKELGVRENDSVEFFWCGGRLVLKKHEPACAFCGGADGLAAFAGKNICRACRENIAALK